MNQERLMKILLAPRVSEKTVRLNNELHQVTFIVRSDATKPEIKSAVEMLFNVKVDAVRVVNVAGKERRFGRKIGRRSDWKKAYISLKPNFFIDVSNPQ